MKKNDIFEVIIEDVTFEGYGIAKIDGMVVFIPNCVCEDKIIFKTIKANKNFSYGKLLSIVEKSGKRIDSDCVYSKRCGGCAFRNISYETELKIKELNVRDCLARIGGLKDIEISSIVASPKKENYRNKVQIPVRDVGGKSMAGFFVRNSHRVIDCKTCKLQPDIMDSIINKIREFIFKYDITSYNEEKRTGVVRHIYIRRGVFTKEIMVCLVVNNKFAYEKEFASYLLNIFQDIKTIIINYNFKNTNVVLGDSDRIIHGNGYINDKLCGLNFKISHKSFYQVNVLQAENLYNIAKKLLSLDKSKTLLDLYCGTGTIGLTMANEAKEVIGIDIVPQAIDDACENAKLNKIKNAKFYCGDSGDIIRKLRQNGFSPEAVVLDPPRKGCNDKTLDEIVTLQPENIAYISCNPATLSRDLKKFAGRGYHVKTLVPVDMFPRTPHVETVVLMSRVKE